jgi:hypothetical protein
MLWRVSLQAERHQKVARRSVQRRLCCKPCIPRKRFRRLHRSLHGTHAGQHVRTVSVHRSDNHLGSLRDAVCMWLRTRCLAYLGKPSDIDAHTIATSVACGHQHGSIALAATHPIAAWPGDGAQICPCAPHVRLCCQINALAVCIKITRCAACPPASCCSGLKHALQGVASLQSSSP